MSEGLHILASDNIPALIAFGEAPPTMAALMTKKMF
jgi:hypothetical protein